VFAFLGVLRVRGEVNALKSVTMPAATAVVVCWQVLRFKPFSIFAADRKSKTESPSMKALLQKFETKRPEVVFEWKDPKRKRRAGW
jgi:hypothetical protein